MLNINKFEPYLTAHVKASKFFKESDTLLEKAANCERQIKEAFNPFFTLTEVAQDEFALEFQASPVSMGLRALPYAFLNVLRGIYHFALGVITFSSMRRNIAKRDFEEAYGRWIGVSDVEKGAYFVQRAQFHKSSYEYYLTLKKEKSYWDIPHYRDSQLTTLRQLLANPSFFIAKFELEKYIDEEFLEKLKNLPNWCLDLPLSEFKNNPDYIKKYYLITDEEFASIKLSELKDVYGVPVSVIEKRYFFFKDVPYKESEEVSLNKILNGKTEIAVLIKELSPKYYFLIPNEQIKDINLSELDTDQLFQILRKRQDKTLEEIVDRLPSEKVKRMSDYCRSNYVAYLKTERIEKMSKEDVQSSMTYFSGSQLRAISIEILKELDISRLNPESLKEILNDPKKVQCLTCSQIESLSYSPGEVLKHLSIDQIKGLDFKKLSYSMKRNLFKMFTDDQLKEIIVKLDVIQITDVLSVLEQKNFAYLTDDQVKALPYHNLHDLHLQYIFNPEDSKKCESRFDLLPPEVVETIIARLWSGFEHISDELLKKLDLTKIDSSKLESLLGISYFSLKPRLSKITDKQFESICSRLNTSSLKCVSVRQVFILMDKLEAHEREDIEYFARETLSQIPMDQLETIIDKFEEYDFLTEDQIKAIDFAKSKISKSKFVESISIQKLAVLNTAQIQDILNGVDGCIRLTNEQYQGLDFTKLNTSTLCNLMQKNINFYLYVSKEQLEACYARNIKLDLYFYEISGQAARLGLTAQDLERFKPFCKTYDT